MQRSNGYIMMFILTLTVVCGALLSLVQESLKDQQAANVAFEKRQFILMTYMGEDAVKQLPKEEVNKIYETQVVSSVINFNGEIVEGKQATDVEIAKEYKKPLEERLLPVYSIKGEGDNIDYYVLPVYGFGLWDNIWGYTALEGDMNTIKGVVFDHKAETPGLGARITTDEIRSRFAGKKIKDEAGNLVSVAMQKGEQGGGDKSIEAFKNELHKVDGMSGATLTANGVNDMMANYFKAYQNYFSKNSSKSTVLK